MCVIINHFYFLPFSYVLGTAANCWLTLMDRLLTPEVSVSQKDSIKIKMLELVDIYYLALDAPKDWEWGYFQSWACFVNQPFFFTYARNRFVANHFKR